MLTTLCNDGPLFLWTICNHIHCNNVAFVESIKHKIHSATLAMFSNDACVYIVHIKDNLCLITLNDSINTTHNDLLVHIFNQLASSPIKAFSEWIQKLYFDYLEAKLPNLTPVTLLKDADNKAQVLKHAGQWKDTETPAIMALQAAFETQKKESDRTIKHLVAHIGQLQCRAPYRPQHMNTNASKDPDSSRDGKRPHPDGQPYTHPTWMVTAPQHPTEVQVVD
jgi:hypothetical protein